MCKHLYTYMQTYKGVHKHDFLSHVDCISNNIFLEQYSDELTLTGSNFGICYLRLLYFMPKNNCTWLFF